jgi:death-on-curing protein
MAVTYLTTDQLVALHERALLEGGLQGVRSWHALASAVGQVEQAVFGEDAYPSVPEKAAAYAFFITAGHPFNDGNKRTAAAALDVFLDLNGYALEQIDDEIEEMMVSLAAHTVDQSEFFGWVVNHAKPADAPAAKVSPFKA